MSVKPNLWRCCECGSNDLRWDAFADFDPVAQEFTLAAEYDQTYCEECGGECRAESYTPEGTELTELEQQIAEHEARARLNRAAPELLAALERCIHSLSPDDPLRKVAAAAIAKATGA